MGIRIWFCGISFNDYKVKIDPKASQNTTNKGLKTTTEKDERKNRSKWIRGTSGERPGIGLWAHRAPQGGSRARSEKKKGSNTNS